MTSEGGGAFFNRVSLGNFGGLYDTSRAACQLGILSILLGKVDMEICSPRD